MKHVKKTLALLIAAMMVLTLGAAALADTDTPSITIISTATSDATAAESTVYTYWKILDADIENDPTVTLSGNNDQHGVVAYYVTTEAAKSAIEDTGLFNVSRVGTAYKWYVELKDKATTAAQIVQALNSLTDAQMTTAFGESGTMSSDGVKAESGTLAPGYYFIRSSLGTEIALQTLSAVTINEKNQYPGVDKTVDTADANAQIGDEISYTLTVDVPPTANDAIVLTDTMHGALTFKSIDSVKAGDADVAHEASPTTAAEITANGNKFTVTFTADTVKANQGKKIVITYTAVLNNKATVSTPITNTVELKYGNHYTSKGKTAETHTYEFTFDKVDGSDHTTKLTGAEFQLTLDGETPINLIEVEAGKSYRIAMGEDTATPVTTIATIGETVTILGMDTDVTYNLVETKAPTGYNKLNTTVEVKAGENGFAHLDIANNKGSELPSTGGIGTTIFYVGGSVLVVVAIILLVTKRRTKGD